MIIIILNDNAKWVSMQEAITRIDTTVATDHVLLQKIATVVNKMEKQMSDLSDAVASVSADLETLSTKLDGETTEIGKVIALLQQGNPDVPAAVTALQAIHTRVGTLSSTVDQHVSTLDGALPPSGP